MLKCQLTSTLLLFFKVLNFPKFMLRQPRHDTLSFYKNIYLSLWIFNDFKLLQKCARLFPFKET